MESCLQILIPTPEQFFISEGSEDVDIDDNLDFSGPTSEAAGKLYCLKMTDFFSYFILYFFVNNFQDEPNVELDVNAATYRETGMLKGSFSINIDLPKSNLVLLF